MKAEVESNGQIIQIDTSEMEKRINDNTDEKLKKYFSEVKEQIGKKEVGGKGVVEAFSPDAKKILLEEFHKGSRLDPAKIMEQWTIAVPKFATFELAGHLRDYCWVTDVVKGQPGETVNIPYVTDVEFADVTPKTGTFTIKTDLINVLTTTLHEAGAYYDVYYGDIEKIDSNLLDELNRVFAHAAIRTEDDSIITLINTAITGEFTSRGATTETAPFFVGTTGTALTADFVVDALAALMRRGKEIHPNECVLLVRPKMWGALVKDVIGSTPLSASRPDIAAKGIVEDLLGVKILVVGTDTTWHAYQGGKSSFDWAYLMRPKRAFALAPKRDILIETDKLIDSRKLRIVATHTWGVVTLDMSEVMPIANLNGKK